LLLSASLLSGCGGHKQARQQLPPPPSIPAHPPTPVPSETTSETKKESAKEAAKESGEQTTKVETGGGKKPIYEETGLASWYGAPYHNRVGSNGEVYDMNAMTAAHRTLPLGSVARITNLKTGHSAVVRITDRGPFVEGRIVDLSLAAAKAVDVYVPGTAKVRLDLLESPSPLDTGGRWAVQIGPFAGEKGASKLAGHLQSRYRGADVLKYASPTGAWWVRVRVPDDDRQRAQALARDTETEEGSIFLVRLD
jgi:rare lipoprotein A